MRIPGGVIYSLVLSVAAACGTAVDGPNEAENANQVRADGGSATLAAAGLTAPNASTPIVRESWQAFSKDQSKLASLRRGVEVMKSRSPSDPKSWFYQASVHGVTPAAIAIAEAQDPNVANVDQQRFWNQCPHGGAGSANFLPWHRAYLFHFEQILREAAGDPDLALPYWDYTDVGQRTFPQEFAPEFLDAAGTLPNSLYHPTRELSFVVGLVELTDRAADDGRALQEATFFGPNDRQGFAGSESDSEVRTKAPVESVPHDMLHVATGGIIDETTGGMASVPTAAFDPIFWVHHANIDRIWSEWDCSAGKTWGNLPVAGWLDAAPWEFHSVDGTIDQRTRLEYIRLGHSSVAYDDPLARCGSPVSFTEPPTTEGPPMIALLKDSGRRSVISQSSDTQVVTRNAAMTVSLLSADTLNESDSIESFSSDPRRAESARVILSLRNVTLSSLSSVGFDVFVGAGDEIDLSRNSESYVGTIGLFGIPIEGDASHHDGHGVGSEAFDITSIVSRLGESSGDLRVTIFPFDVLQPVEGDVRFEREGALRFDGFELSILEAE